MRLTTILPATMWAAALAATLQCDPLDRIAVTVDHHVIAESDILRDVRCAAFIDARAADLSADAKRQSAARLVDQYLILEDAASVRTQLPGPGAEEPLLGPIRARFASNAAFQAALSDANISEGELREQLLNGLRLLNYTESRFRTQVDISEDDLQAEYKKLSSGKTNPPDFEASREQLEQLLSSQRTGEALDQWLEGARKNAHIVYHEAAFS